MTTSYVGKENNKVKFTMEFTAEEFEAAIQQAYLKNRGRIQVDGFRRGKAPRKIIEAKYGSGIFFDEAIDSMLQDNYGKALDELNIEPINRPSVDFEGDEKIEQGKGFKVIVEVEVPPEVELKEYKGVKVERELLKVEDDAVEQELKRLQKKGARLIDVDEPANWDDSVVLDYKGFVGDEQFQGGTAEDHTLVLGSNTFIPGFEAQLIGVKKGDEKDVVVTFPEEYHAEDLAGKEAVFKCTIKGVKREELPELNDDFAKDMSAEFDTLEELKADIAKSAQERVDQRNDTISKTALLDKLCELNPIDIPAVMITDEAEKMYEDFAQQIRMQGIDIDMYCKYAGTTPEEMKKGYEEEARKRVHSRLLVEAIAEKEKIEAADEDLEKELDEYAEAYKRDKEEVRSMLGEGSIGMIKKDIRNRKTVDFLCENAKFTEPRKKAEKAEKPAAKKTTKKADADKEEKPAAKKPAAKKTTKKAEASENTEA